MSDSESDSDSSSSSSEEVKKAPVPVKAVEKKDESDSDSSDSEDSSDEAEAKKTKVKIFAAKKTEEKDSDSDSDSSDSEEEKKPVAVAKKEEKAEDSDSSDSDSSDSEDEKEEAKKPVAKPVEDDSDSDSSDSEEEKPAAKPVAVEKKEEEESDSSDDESEGSDADDEAEAEKASEKEPEKMEVEEKEVDFTKSLANKVTITPVFAWNVSESTRKGKKRKLENASSSTPVAKKAKAEDSSSTSESTTSASSGSVSMEPTKDFYATDYKNSHLKGKTSTVFIKGIDIEAFETDIAEFFSDVEKPIQVRHKWFEDRPGIAFIQFSSPEVATKCVIDKNNEYIKSRYINTDWSEERKKSLNTRGPRNAHLKDTTNRVWMGNLHREVQEENIIEYFSSVGVLTDVYIIGRDETRPKIAYISFESNELASKAVETLQAGSLLDYTVRLDWAEPRQNSGGGQKRTRELSEKPEGCVTVFVGRLSDNVDDDKLRELFKDAGEISQIRYLERDGEFKGSAFIEFLESDSTDKAVKLNGSSFLNRQIRVDFAEQSNKRARY